MTLSSQLLGKWKTKGTARGKGKRCKPNNLVLGKSNGKLTSNKPMLLSGGIDLKGIKTKVIYKTNPLLL